MIHLQITSLNTGSFFDEPNLVIFFYIRCLVNLYKLEIFKDAVTEPLNVQISNLLKVSQR